MSTIRLISSGNWQNYNTVPTANRKKLRRRILYLLSNSMVRFFSEVHRCSSKVQFNFFFSNHTYDIFCIYWSCHSEQKCIGVSKVENPSILFERYNFPLNVYKKRSNFHRCIPNIFPLVSLHFSHYKVDLSTLKPFILIRFFISSIEIKGLVYALLKKKKTILQAKMLKIS